MRDDNRRGSRDNHNDNSYRGNRDNRNQKPYSENRFDGPGRKPYGGKNFDRPGRRSYGEKPYEEQGRRPYGENRFDGPGRRTYGDDRRPRGDNPPRVGRVVENVPQARRVTGDYHAPRREDVVDRDFSRRPKHGGAYRSESGPGEYRRSIENYDYEAPEIPEELAAEFTDAPMDDEHMLVGRNPIREALKAGRPMEKLLVADGDLSGAGREIIKLARTAGVVVQVVDRSRLDQIYPAHQGMLAYVAAVPYTPLEDMLAAAKGRGEAPFIVVLDGITDPHNLGAIIRSAECAGAHGVVIPERRAAGLSPAAAKAAAGALNHMPVARVKNLNRALEELKAAGLWVTGAAMDGENAWSADLTGPIALVIGSEGDGISRLTLEKCDRVVSVPIKGHIDSLNASVAAGVLMYEILRQRGL